MDENYDVEDHLEQSQGTGILIPQAQIMDVLHNLNMREGIFSEDDLNHLENGYSVSDTDGERTHIQDGDILSLRSGLSGAGQLASAYLRNSPGDKMDGANADSNLAGLISQQQRQSYNLNSDAVMHRQGELENQIRNQEQQNLLYQEIASQKIKYFKKIAYLEKLIEQVKGEKAQLHVIIETQKQNFGYQQTQLENKHQAELRDMREKHARGEAPLFQEKLNSYKQDFSKANLLVPEETYIDYKNRPYEHLSLKEYVQMRVFEALQEYVQELDQHQGENTKLFHSLKMAQNKLEKDQIEISALRSQLKEVKDESDRRVQGLERRNLDLETDFKQLDSQYNLLNEKGGQLNRTEENARKLEHELGQLKGQKKELESQVGRLQEQKNDTERHSDGLRRQIDLLNQDKNFLSRENTNLEEKVSRLEDKVDRTEMSLLDAKKQAEKYMDRVLSANDDVKSKFETQYSKEMDELKDRQTKELNSMKQNLTDLYERKVDYLTERKDEQERRINKLEADLRDKAKSYEELIFEFRTLQKAGDEQLGQLKLDVRSKQDNAVRIQHLYEDNLINVKETKLENESLKQKMDVLRSEYYKLESQARQGNADIKAELAVCKERLGNYEMIERELDQAIMHVADNDQVTGDGAYDIGNALIQTITNAPTTAKRRIQQSLLLANRLQQKQKEVEAMLQEIHQLKQKLESTEAEVKLHKRLTERTNQPHNYILADIERAEKELEFANRKINQLDQNLKRSKHENEQLKAQKARINDDLQRLLSKRGEIESLQTALMGVIRHSSNRKIDVDELRSMLATQLKAAKHGTESSSVFDSMQAPTRMKSSSVNRSSSGHNRSRSRSKGHTHAIIPISTLMGGSLAEARSSAATMKMQQAYEDDSAVPAWYRTLKKNVRD